MSRIVSVALCILLLTSSAWAAKFDIPAPDGINNGNFGAEVKVLPNGNFVVTDPDFNLGGVSDAGQVYLYSLAGRVYLYSRDGELLATLTGGRANDRVGSGGITVLANGNYVVSSLNWGNNTAANVGAVTWRSSTASGGNDTTVSDANSLVGSSQGDFVGTTFFAVTALTNGNYVVNIPEWDNIGAPGSPINAGAVTWGDGATGVSGAISAANSLVGDSANDKVGHEVKALTNGHYVARSPYWDNGNRMNAGAATWANGATGITGVVSAANSLVGDSANDYVGISGVTALTNGNYVVTSGLWNNGNRMDVGAATWGNGATGITGVVSAANSLVGNSANDRVGNGDVTALTNGHYVVVSAVWNNGNQMDAGAATWGNGATGIIGVVSAANSLVGGSADDSVGNFGVMALTNGHYVVRSLYWDNPVGNLDVGAATWGNGVGGTSGVVSAANSLVGSSANDRVGYSVIPLSNGNYVVSSEFWDKSGAIDAGAVTWGDGSIGTMGLVSALNSLVGSAANFKVGSGGVTPLSNGHYVVHSPSWGLALQGAVTWMNGAGPFSGSVSMANSLYGAEAGDMWSAQVRPLLNGDYVVRGNYWGPLSEGGVAWMNGAGPFSGSVAVVNSLYGTEPGDMWFAQVTALPNGDYVVLSPWNNGGVVDAGAVVWGSGAGGIAGAMDPFADHTVVGDVPNSFHSMVFSYDAGDGAACDQLVIGRPVENIVTVLDNPSCP